MNKLHIAISTNKINETVIAYTERLGAKPCSYIPNEYAFGAIATPPITVAVFFKKFRLVASIFVIL